MRPTAWVRSSARVRTSSPTIPASCSATQSVSAGVSASASSSAAARGAGTGAEELGGTDTTPRLGIEGAESMPTSFCGWSAMRARPMKEGIEPGSEVLPFSIRARRADSSLSISILVLSQDCSVWRSSGSEQMKTTSHLPNLRTSPEAMGDSLIFLPLRKVPLLLPRSRTCHTPETS